MADRLRGWLESAGIKRRELLDATATTKPLGFHDLRATGLTWMAVRGDQPLTIMQRAGHEDDDADLHPNGRGSARRIRRRLP